MPSCALRPRILVTGGAGFNGSHLCERLLAADNDVLCIDNFFTGTRNTFLHLLNNQHFELLRHDVTEPVRVEVDRIFILACPASPVHDQFNPAQTVKTSVHGAINMLGLAKRTKARILQAPTSEVYGDAAVHPQTEDYWGNVNPIGPRAYYDEGKRSPKPCSSTTTDSTAVQIKVIRIFNIYGPRMHPKDGRVVSNLIMQAQRGEDLTSYGDGSQTCRFCFVDDRVEDMMHMMGSRSTASGRSTSAIRWSSP